MNVIWDIALRAKQSGLAENELFFRQAEYCSPWYEQSLSVLNQQEITSKTVEINALCRFDTIFQRLLHPDLVAMPEFREYLFDLVVHLLLETDIVQGLTKQEYHIHWLRQEMETGVYGEELAADYRVLPTELKNRLASLMLSQLKTGSSLFLFRKAVRIACPGAILYQLHEEPEQLLLYLGRKESRQYEHRTRCIMEGFLPIHYRVRLFWEHHFGVLGADYAMKLDEIEIF